MPKEMRNPFNPVDEILARLALHGRHDVDPSVVAAGWHEVLYPVLERNVGERLCAGLSTLELSEFEALVASGDEEGASVWLAEHVPDYRDIVHQEFEALLDTAVARLLTGLAEKARGNTR